MNKKNIICILVIILIIVIGVFYTLKNNPKEEDIKTDSIDGINNIILDTLEKSMEKQLDTIKDKNPVDGSTFYGELTIDEWTNHIKKYYATYMDFDPIEYKANYDNQDRLQIIAICDDFLPEDERENIFTVVDDKRGIVEDGFGNVIMLFGEEIIIGNKNVSAEFSDNQVLVIAYVNQYNYDETVAKYCELPGNYELLDKYDYTEYSDGCEFLFIQKDDTVSVSIYTCNITEDGELEKDELIVNNQTSPFVFICDYIGDLPTYVVEMKCKGYETVFPLVFSGKDGTIDLTGNESEVKDISIYSEG